MAEQHVQAAVDAGGAVGVDPEILLGMAQVESDFNPHRLSWRSCQAASCTRKTGVWRAAHRPPNGHPTFYCGYLQVGGNVSWDLCRLYMQDLRLNYLAGAVHLKDWAKLSGAATPRCKGASLQSDWGVRCALRGYNGGFWEAALKDHIYPRMVLRAATRLMRTARQLQREEERRNS